ncbi:MAG TPA: hypothetical protein VGM23_02555, partial [Armatimonadota bacterium]
RADGTIQPEFVERLHAMGDWMEQHGEGIYGSQRCPYSEMLHVLGPATVRDRKVYFHLFNWPGSEARIAGLPVPIHDVRLLTTGETVLVQLSRHVDVQTLSLPAEPPASLCPVIAVESATSAQIGQPPAVLQPRVHSMYEPDLPPIIWGDALKDGQVPAQTTIRGSETWCPGWHGMHVFSTSDGLLQCELPVPVTGRYRLEIGVIGDQSAPLSLSIDDLLVKRVSRMRTPGYPHMLSLPPMTLAGGNRRLTLRLRRGVPFGIYGMQLVPCLRALPSPLWSTIGPFPSGFDIQHTDIELVRTALTTVFPPETAYQPEAVYSGTAGLPVRWQTARSARGAHAKSGVNFAFRGASKVSGVCYARTVITSPVAREAELLIGCDWWAKAFINGAPITSSRTAANDEEVLNSREAIKVEEDGAQFNGWKPTPARMQLRAGENELLVKCHQGSVACWFTCFISDPGDLAIKP